MASQEGHSEGLSTRDAAMVVPPESPPFRAGRFKGYQLVWRLLAAGHEVTILNRGTHQDPFGHRVTRLRADRTTSEFAEVLQGKDFDAVVDFAAYQAADAREAVNVLRGQTDHYVFISSGAVYMVQEGASRPCTHPWSETDYTDQVSPAPDAPGDFPSWRYGANKREAEAILGEAWRLEHFPVTILRLPIVNGERDPDRRLESYLWRILDGGPVLLPDGGTNLTRHVYSGEVAKAIVGLLGMKSTQGEVFNLSQEEQPSLLDLVQILAGLLGAPCRVQSVSAEALAQVGLASRDISPFSGRWSSRLDPSRATTMLDFHHQPLVQYLDKIVSAWMSYPPTTPPDDYRDRQKELLVGMKQ